MSIIKNWLRNRNTAEFLGIWEQIYNPTFNSVEFDRIRKQTGLNTFVLSVKKWVEATRAIGIIAKTGRYGGWLSARVLNIAVRRGVFESPCSAENSTTQKQTLKDLKRKLLNEVLG